VGETHDPATLARPEIAAPIGDPVAMFFAEIVDEHFLNPRGKGIDTNLADVNSAIVIVIVCGTVRKVLDVRVLLGSNSCRAHHQECGTLK
jgi:hypothetical protein